MTNDDEILESDKFALEDNSGYDELAEAFKKIDELQNNPASAQESTKEELPQEELEEEIEESEEDEPEEDSGEILEEDDETEEKPLKKPDKMWKVKRRLYKTKSELRAAEEENARLRDMVSQLETAGTYQYGRNVYSELDRAKEQMQKAIDSGDHKAFGEAVFNLTSAQHKANDLERLATQAPAAPPPPPQQSYSSNDVYNNSDVFNEAATEFLDSHKELRKNSKFYNKALAESVIKYANKIDRGRKEAGMEDINYANDPDQILDYFESIEDYIIDWRAKDEKRRKSVASVSAVGGVRNSYNSQNNNQSKTRQMVLTPAEKEMAKLGGYTEKEWIESKLELERKGKL